MRLALLVFTALALITLDFRGSTGVFGSARDSALELLGPVRSASDTALSPFRDAWNGITGYDELVEENRRLQAELDGVDGATLKVAEIQRRLREFELLAGRTDESLADRVIATVIDAPLSNFERTIELNRGSNDDIEKGMPVESGSGLIGEVVQLGRNRSRVELLTDASFAVGVRLVRSGDAGVARGNGAGRPMTIEFIKLETVVVPGESVVTSGLEGSKFPAGILVGTVIGARPDPVTGRQEVDIEPVANLDRLTLVQVVLYSPPVIDNRPVPTTTTSTTTTTTVADTSPALDPAAPLSTSDPTAPTRTTVTQVVVPSSAAPQAGDNSTPDEPSGARPRPTDSGARGVSRSTAATSTPVSAIISGMDFVAPAGELAEP